MSKRIVKVSRDQVHSARMLIKLMGGEDKVEPVVVNIAHARRLTPEEIAAAAS
jgi:hypothetical protein